MRDIEPTSPSFDPSEVDDVDEHDVRLIAFLEGDLCQKERKVVEAKLESDDRMRRDFDQLADVADGLKNLPFEFAPPDFVDGVERRIRKRSRGVFFANHFLSATRTPYEAIAVVMIIVMAAAWLSMDSPKDRHLKGTAVHAQPELKTRHD